MIATWKLWAILAVLAVAGVATWQIRGMKDDLVKQNELAAQESALHAQCDAKEAITKETNDALQKNLSIVTGRLNSLKRLHPSVCIVPTGRVAEPTAGGEQHAGQNGISTDWLRDFAAECENYRSEVDLLNQFGIAERKAQ